MKSQPNAIPDDAAYVVTLPIRASGPQPAQVVGGSESRDHRVGVRRLDRELWADVPGSPVQGKERVKITSRAWGGQVYVARLVKSSGRWSTRRYLIPESSIEGKDVS